MKTTTVIIIVALAFLLTACGGGGESTVPSGTVTVTTKPYAIPAYLSDGTLPPPELIEEVIEIIDPPCHASQQGQAHGKPCQGASK